MFLAVHTSGVCILTEIDLTLTKSSHRATPFRMLRSDQDPNLVMPSIPTTQSTNSNHNSVAVTKKRVSFHNRVRVFLVMNVEDYSDCEKSATWLQASDDMRIKLEILFTLAEMRRGADIDEDSISRRGIEFRTYEGPELRARSKASGLQAVLQEQEYQRNLCFDDPDLIARKYADVAHVFQIAAKFVARADAIEAQKVHALGRAPNKKIPESSNCFSSIRLHQSVRLVSTAAA